jgi:hypothetical protein
VSAYDWFLLLGVVYTGVGSDLLLNWAAGLITGKRLRGDAGGWFERTYHRVHARNDPNMRADAPVDGPADRIAAWNHALAVANGTIVLALEAMIVWGFVAIGAGRSLPDAARLAAFAWLMRSVWGELSYWHVLTAGAVAPLRGWPLAWYWVIGMPQAFFPFLVAERFYAATAAYSFTPLRFVGFLAVPVALMALMKLTYRGRVW